MPHDLSYYLDKFHKTSPSSTIGPNPILQTISDFKKSSQILPKYGSWTKAEKGKKRLFSPFHHGIDQAKGGGDDSWKSLTQLNAIKNTKVFTSVHMAIILGRSSLSNMQQKIQPYTHKHFI